MLNLTLDRIEKSGIVANAARTHSSPLIRKRILKKPTGTVLFRPLCCALLYASLPALPWLHDQRVIIPRIPFPWLPGKQQPSTRRGYLHHATHIDQRSASVISQILLRAIKILPGFRILARFHRFSTRFLCTEARINGGGKKNRIQQPAATQWNDNRSVYFTN